MWTQDIVGGEQVCLLVNALVGFNSNLATQQLDFYHAPEV
jgi:hypothetical protein